MITINDIIEKYVQERIKSESTMDKEVICDLKGKLDMAIERERLINITLQKKDEHIAELNKELKQTQERNCSMSKAINATNDIIENYVKERIAGAVTEYRTKILRRDERIAEVEKGIEEYRKDLTYKDSRIKELIEQTKLDKDCIAQLIEQVCVLNLTLEKRDSEIEKLKEENSKLQILQPEKTVPVGCYQYNIDELFEEYTKLKERYETAVEDKDRYYDIIVETYNTLGEVI